MTSKLAVSLFALFILLSMAVYFLVNPSYEKSLRAKYYYEIGDYRESYTLAKEAFDIDLYNRMASTIMTQSQISLKYVGYIEDAKKYMKEIDTIALHKNLTDADRAKIKMICHIMLGSYVKLAPSVITNETLVAEAQEQYKKFEKLFEKVNKK
jgi:tetratricopeptide (TPR) repeat protein